jgi:flagellar motor switch protein FliN/FliY
MTYESPLTLPDLETPPSSLVAHSPITEGDLDPVLDVPIKLTAILGRTKLPISEVLKLAEGSVLELEKAIGEPVELLVNDRLVARGEVVLVDNQLGVTLSEIA